MVIASSDSCNTLVSLDNGIKQNIGKDIQPTSVPEPTFVQTEILLPADEYDYDDYGDDECDDSQKYNSSCEQKLYLPAKECGVDLYLRTVLLETTDELLASPPRIYNEESSESILYVAQGEVGYAIASQCDVICSDKATTCHILAFRSTCGDSAPLVSLAHLDSASYEDCIRGMVQQHMLHHMVCESDENSSEEEKKQDEEYLHIANKIEMDIHILGGFEDEDGSSREVSEFLMNLLARLASEEQSFVRMTLQTCAISSMNDNGMACPIGRGLGIDLKTGQAFLVKVDRSVAGPCQELRSVRLWSNGPKKLSIIHTASSKNLTVSPFHFAPFEGMDKLLCLADHVVLQLTSTSPDVEEDDFCSNIRKTLRFISSHKSSDIFGKDCDSPVTYRRVGNCNQWEKVAA